MYTSKDKREHGRSAGKNAGKRPSPIAIAASVAVGAMFGDSAHAAKHIQVQHVSAGAAKLTQDGPHTTIVASNHTIIDYTRFDVARYESVQFILPNVHASILNRIHSVDPSQIDGQVVGNGSIYFANPAGVIFGPHSVVNVGKLYAAAGNISNADFLAGTNHFTVGQGSVVNEGSIHADTVAMVGRQVVNHGVIVGESTVTMVSGDDVLLGDRNGGILVKMNPATVSQVAPPAAPALPLGAGDLYSLAITNTGQVKGPGINVQAGSGTVNVSGRLDASSKIGKGGQINVTAPRVTVNSANLDASGKTGGGTILVGGDAHGQGTLPNAQQTTVSAGSTLNANAVQSGDGGKVVVWSNNSTEFHGAITARGGAASGNGGFVETSGHVLNIDGGSVDASAPHGTAGNWLLDPFDV